MTKTQFPMTNDRNQVSERPPRAGVRSRWSLVPSLLSFRRACRLAFALAALAPLGMTYSIGGTATNSRGTSSAFSHNYVTFGGVSVTQPLLRGFGFGATLVNRRVAKANRGISDWQHRQTVIDTVTNVI